MLAQCILGPATSFRDWGDEFVKYLTRWQRVLFVSVVCLCLGGNLYVLITGIEKAVDSRENPSSSFSREDVTELPPFALVFPFVSKYGGPIIASSAVSCPQRSTNSMRCTMAVDTAGDNIILLPDSPLKKDSSMTLTVQVNYSKVPVTDVWPAFVIDASVLVVTSAGVTLDNPADAGGLPVLMKKSSTMFPFLKVSAEVDLDADVTYTWLVIVQDSPTYDTAFENIATAEFTSRFASFSIMVDKPDVAYTWRDILATSLALLNSTGAFLAYFFPTIIFAPEVRVFRFTTTLPEAEKEVVADEERRKRDSEMRSPVLSSNELQ